MTVSLLREASFLAADIHFICHFIRYQIKHQINNMKISFYFLFIKQLKYVYIHLSGPYRNKYCLHRYEHRAPDRMNSAVLILPVVL